MTEILLSVASIVIGLILSVTVYQYGYDSGHADGNTTRIEYFKNGAKIETRDGVIMMVRKVDVEA